MKCMKCGTENSAGSKFCFNCGNPFIPAQEKAPEEAAPEKPAYQSMNQYGQSAGQFYGRNPNANNMSGGASMHQAGSNRPSAAALMLLREMATSILFFVAIICYSLQLLFNIIASGSAVSGAANSILYTSGLGQYLPGNFSRYIYAASGASVFITLLISIPGILIAVGLWMIFVNGLKKHTEDFKATGFKIIWVVELISLIIGMLAMAIVLILMFVAVASVSKASSYMGDYGSYADASMGILLVAIIFIIALAAFFVIYSLKILQAIKAGQELAMYGKTERAFSMLVIVLLFISGGFSALSALMSLASGGLLSFLKTGCGAASAICFGLVLLQMKNKYMAVKNGSYLFRPSALYNAAVKSDAVNRMSESITGTYRNVSGQNYGQAENVQPNYGQAENVQPNYGQAENMQPNYGRAENMQPNYGQQDYVRQDHGAQEYSQFYHAQTDDSQAENREPGNAWPAYGQEDDDRTEYIPQGSAFTDDPEATVLMTNATAEEKTPYLRRTSTGEVTAINYTPFRIGKDPKQNDYAITGNPVISRNHAVIDFRNGDFYIIDRNSSNHVYVNDERIPKGGQNILQDGTKIVLGNEELIFEMK